MHLFFPGLKLTATSLEQATQKALILQPPLRKPAEWISSIEKQLQRGSGFAKDGGKLGHVPFCFPCAPPWQQLGDHTAQREAKHEHGQ